jgi:hypothetical protein
MEQQSFSTMQRTDEGEWYQMEQQSFYTMQRTDEGEWYQMEQQSFYTMQRTDEGEWYRIDQQTTSHEFHKTMRPKSEVKERYMIAKDVAAD